MLVAQEFYEWNSWNWAVTLTSVVLGLFVILIITNWGFRLCRASSLKLNNCLDVHTLSVVEVMCGLFVKLTMPAMKFLPRQLKTRHTLTYVSLTILTWWPGKYAWPQYFYAGTGVIHVCLAVPARCPQHSYYGQKPQQLCWAIDYDYSCSLEECVWLPDQTLNTQTEGETYGRHCNRNQQGFFLYGLLLYKHWIDNMATNWNHSC